MQKIRKKALLSLLLVLTMMAGLFPQITARAGDEENVTFQYLVYDDSKGQIVVDCINLKEAEDDVYLLEDDEHEGAYRVAEAGDDTTNAPVHWSADDGILILNNYICDYADKTYGDGVEPDEIIFANVEVSLKIIGECFITNANGLCIWVEQGGLKLLKGSDDASLSLTSSGKADEADEYSYYMPIGLGGNSAEFTNEVALTLIAEDKPSAEDWDLSMEGIEGDSPSLADRIHNTGEIDGVIPQEEEESSEEGPGEIYIGESGLLFDDENAPAYWKVDEAGLLSEGTATDYQLYYDASGRTLTLKNFVYEGNGGIPLVADCGISLVLVGTNKISYAKDTAVFVNGSLDISGSGSLEVVTTCTGLLDENGDIIYDEDGTKTVPAAMSVCGSSFHNSATLTCKAASAAWVDLSLDVPGKNVGNTGKVYGRFAAFGDEASYVEGTDMTVPDDTDYAMPTDHEYLGKAYYFTSETFYPDNFTGGGRAEDEWLTVGQYDDDGEPIPSHVFYQYYYVDENGAYKTEDFHYPVSYLVYDENPETLVTDKDIVAVADGKSHTFEANLYAVWFTRGNVTVNGNVFLDVACFEQAQTAEGDETRTQYVRDDEGNILFMENSTGASITINGNTGFLSLNDSYDGTVIINGDVQGSARYDDINVKNGEYPEEFYYGAVPNAGKIMENGKLLKDLQTLEGYKGQAVYQDAFYMKTERVINGEAVKGTTAAVNGDALLVDVGANGVSSDTYPLVRESGETERSRIQAVLTDKDSKLTAMDISLIRGNKAEVEPDGAVSLYIDNLTGFKDPALYHIKSDGTIEMLETLKMTGGSLKVTTSSFSTYFVAEKQELLSNNINNIPSAEGQTAVTTQTPAAVVTTPKTGDDFSYTYILLLAAAAAMMTACAGRLRKMRR